METRSIDEVYAANDAIREKLLALVTSADPSNLNRLPDGEKWTVTNIVEHLGMVEASAIRICRKLLGKAEADGKAGDGAITTSDSFSEKGRELFKIKVEAPGIVQPKCEMAINEALEHLQSIRSELHEMKPLFNAHNSADYQFPHPYLGELSAGEWLVLIGGHEARHTKQIGSMLEKLRKKSPGYEEGL